MMMRYFLIIFLIILQNIFAETQPSFEIEFAYLRKQHPEFDKGTIHLFLKNITASAQSIRKVWVNDEEITDEITDTTIWKQFLPYSIPHGKSMDVMVKLASPMSNLIKIEVEDSNGCTYSRVIQPFPPDLKISYIGFEKDYKTLYVWVRNTGKEKQKINSILLDSQDVSSFTKLKPVKADSKQCYKIKLQKALTQGEYISVKINGKEDVLAESLIRVFSYFPVTSWDGDTRQEYGFDSRSLLMGPVTEDKQFDQCKNAPWFKVYHLFNDPACEDVKNNLPLGGHAKKVIELAQKYREQDPVHPVSIYICEYMKPLNYFIYGELADVIMVNPYEVAYYGYSPEKDGYYVNLAKLASEPRLLYAIVEAFKDNNKKRNIHRFPTYEEEFKIVESEINAGAKGLIYFMGNFEKNCGYNNSPELLKAIGEMNSQINKKKSGLLLRDDVEEIQYSEVKSKLAEPTSSCL